MRLQDGQLERIGGAGLRRQLRGAMRRGATGFTELEDAQQAEFVEDALAEASRWGFRTPQGYAAYALALWFLEPDFPATSRYLKALLESSAPEVRKVHAMNEWVSTLLGNPQNMAAADGALRQAFQVTAAWGRQG